MKLLITSDWHWYLTSGNLKRNDIIDTCNNIVDIAIQNKVDYFIHCGDVYHRNVITHQKRVKEFITLCNTLDDAKIQSFFLVGNHDEISRKDEEEEHNHTLSVVQEILYEYVCIVDEPGILPTRTCDFFFVPHISEAKYDGQKPADVTLAKWQERDKNKQIIVFAHTEIEGAVAGTEDTMLANHGFTLPRAIINDKNVVKVFCGHIHKHQDIGKVTIVGAPVYVDASEVNDKKGVILYEYAEVLNV
jgi:DNA repair exonuclease SbcCD nuclease subunit